MGVAQGGCTLGDEKRASANTVGGLFLFRVAACFAQFASVLASSRLSATVADIVSDQNKVVAVWRLLRSCQRDFGEVFLASF